MPEQLVILIAIAGIVIVGLAFTSIDLIKDAGKLIGLALLAFLAILLLNRTMPSSTPSSTYSSSPTAPSYPPGSYPSGTYSPGAYPSGTYSPGAYPSGTYSPGAYPPGTYPPTPYAAQPNPAQPNPAIPNSSSRPFSADSALNGLSGFVKTAFDRIDEFVYGNPYAVEQPSRSLQPDTSVSQQPAATAEQPIVQPAEPGYQIRPDGVPSRVSSPVESAAPVTRPAASTANSRTVSAWW